MMTTPLTDATLLDAILFDMDGTLLTSIAAVERAWTAWAARVGVPADAVLAYMHGRRGIDTVIHFAPAGADVEAEAAWVEAFEMEDVDGIRQIPGVKGFLEALPPERWAVVTSATGALARRRIQAAGLPLPGVLVSSDDVRQGKPDPEGYRLAAKRLGVRIERCVVFEDTDTGLAAGRAAGASVIRVTADHAPQAVGGPSLDDYRVLRLDVRPEGIGLSFRTA